MDPKLVSIGAGLVRHGLTTAGGALAAHGVIGNDPASLESFVGAGMVFAGIAWSWWQKEGQTQVLAALAKFHGTASPDASVSDAAKASADLAASLQKK